MKRAVYANALAFVSLLMALSFPERTYAFVVGKSFAENALSFLSAPVGTTGSTGTVQPRTYGTPLSGTGLGNDPADLIDDSVLSKAKVETALNNAPDDLDDELEDIVNDPVLTEDAKIQRIGEALDIELDSDSFGTVLDFYAGGSGGASGNQSGSSAGASAGSGVNGLKNLIDRIFGSNQTVQVSDLSPYSYVTTVDMGFKEYDAMRDTVSGWYRFMKTLAAGGFVFSIIFGCVKIMVCGSRDRSEVFSGLMAKAFVVGLLLGFVMLFSVYGELANTIIVMLS